MTNLFTSLEPHSCRRGVVVNDTVGWEWECACGLIVFVVLYESGAAYSVNARQAGQLQRLYSRLWNCAAVDEGGFV